LRLNNFYLIQNKLLHFAALILGIAVRAIMALSWFSIPFGLMIHKNNPEIYRHCFFTSAGSTCDHSAAELQKQSED
jgi:hypothetical protein